MSACECRGGRAAAVVVVPGQVGLRQVDLATELQILGYHQHRRSDDDPIMGRVAG